MSISHIIGEGATMRIAVAGATGTAGVPTVALARERGHHVVEVSRSAGVDLLTGERLTTALAGVDVAIDASNPRLPDPEADLVEVYAQATSRLIEACRSAGVEHLVYLSISAIHDPAFDEFPYYLAKRAQEQVIHDSGFPATIIATTQWHEFAMNPAAVTTGDYEVTVQDWLIQPIAVAAVAEALHDAAHSRLPRRSLAGPETLRLPELTQRYLAARGDDRPVRTVETAMPALAEGALLAPEGAELIGPSVEGWLAGQAQ
ncbi:SDR family oxidoreductase [Nesterenkonia sp. F]|uniref:SDR family oxidoreductase n=1 Tax=Nesterenkonia sp. F TaxID=795955 RepID=UPI000255CA00|nr:NAD(P)H-binding protein [Nesterenkonia sp. F]